MRRTASFSKGAVGGIIQGYSRGLHYTFALPSPYLGRFMFGFR